MIRQNPRLVKCDGAAPMGASMDAGGRTKILPAGRRPWRRQCTPPRHGQTRCNQPERQGECNPSAKRGSHSLCLVTILFSSVAGQSKCNYGQLKCALVSWRCFYSAKVAFNLRPTGGCRNRRLPFFSRLRPIRALSYTTCRPLETIVPPAHRASLVFGLVDAPGCGPASAAICRGGATSSQCRRARASAPPPSGRSS